MTLFDLGFGAWDLGFPTLSAGTPVGRSLVVAMGTPPQGGAPSVWVQFIPFLLVLAIFYFIILMPMKKRQQKVQSFLDALKVGDRVITSGGIYGSVTKLNEQSLQLQIANNVRIEVARTAIVGYQGQEPVAPEGNRP
jgi:preprotein translocase subunit YajC